MVRSDFRPRITQMGEGRPSRVATVEVHVVRI
jgi:hypothetical protein